MIYFLFRLLFLKLPRLVLVPLRFLFCLTVSWHKWNSREDWLVEYCNCRTKTCSRCGLRWSGHDCGRHLPYGKGH